MRIWNNVCKGLGVFRHEVKKTYDSKKLELRIKRYRKEETELYARLGCLIYQHREIANNAEFEDICNNLDTIRARMKQLDRLMADIRGRSEEEDAPGYLGLDRKESDLTITRTDEGIKLIRSCPLCKTANNSEHNNCALCGYSLSAKQQNIDSKK